jgi:4-amino-4-deoxy-L-arabinose transferase-like glycosyltransferase
MPSGFKFPLSATEARPAPSTGASAYPHAIPRELTLLLVAGAAVRIALWIWFATLTPHIDDEQAHVQLATTIVTTGEYGFAPGKLTSLRPPLYPAMVAGVFTVAGIENYQAVRFLQALLSLATVVLVFRLGSELYSERVGLRAGAFFCFYPTFLGFNNLILSEVQYTFLLVGGVLAVVRGLNRASLISLGIAGVVLGLGALTRSILFPFAPVLCIFLLFAWRGSYVRRGLAVLAFALPFALVLAPWAVRNSRLQDTFIAVDCMGGRNFMMGNYEYTPLYRSWDAIAIGGEREWIKVLNAHHPEMSGLTQGKVDQLAGKEAIRFIRENPGLTAKRDIVKFFDFWGLERELVAGANRKFFGQLDRSVIAALGIVICGFYAIVLVSGTFGAGLHPPADRRAHILLLLVIGFHCAVHTVVFAHSRYHLPIMPFAMVYSAAALTAPGFWTHRNRVGFWLATTFCVLVFAGWVWGGLAGDFNKLTTSLGFAS